MSIVGERPLRIGVVCYPTFGGSGVVATELSKGMAERGHEIHLFSYAPPARLDVFDEHLHLHQVDYVANDNIESGTVLSQNPPAREEVQLGRKVAVTVAAPTGVIESWTRTISVRVPVAGGPRMQQVKIKVFDQIAQNAIVYDEMHESGSFVDKRIPLEGKATVMIYIQDMENAYREERIPYASGEEE